MKNILVIICLLMSFTLIGVRAANKPEIKKVKFYQSNTKQVEYVIDENLTSEQLIKVQQKVLTRKGVQSCTLDTTKTKFHLIVDEHLEESDVKKVVEMIVHQVVEHKH